MRQNRHFPKWSTATAKKQAFKDIGEECICTGTIVYLYKETDVFRLTDFYKDNTRLIVSI